ncbi:glycosyltransferase family 4 protein [Cetobacterium sp.]|uniref:glycosyltransferase family 4 protein n=1 Tax=Cetobacterium sp. TaxID=2071632 RepID=UPI003EE483E5
MKIAIIGTTASSIISFRKDFIKSLCNHGYEVYTLAIDYDEKTRSEVCSFGAVPVDYSFCRNGLNPVKDLIGTIKLTILLKKLQPDIVFSYFSKPVIFGTIAAVLARVPRRYSMLEGLGYFFTHSGGKDTLKVTLIRKILVFLYRFSFKFIDGLILLNDDDKRDLLIKENINVRQVHVLGGIGLDMDEYPYSPPPIEPISFIFVARFLKEKGVYEFIDAARKIKKQHPRIRFYMLGSLDVHNPGSLSVEHFNELKCNDVIELPGHVNNVQDWLAKASVFVLPSYREGFPRSTQEAMAMGRAVITSDVPGCRDTVIDGVNGFLIPVRSSTELADKMLSFIHNPELIIKMGEASYEIAKHNFDALVTNRKLLNILEINHSLIDE